MNRVLRPRTVAASSSTSPASGHIIDGRYRIRRALGEGTTGHVYLANDLQRNGAPVAIKIAKLALGNDVRRLEQEARLAITIIHPNVCRVLGFGRLSDRRPYLVMEALRGRALSLRLRQEKALSCRVALSICSQILYGLHAVHQLDIVHRDIKPGNVFLGSSAAGGYPRVRLLDFGFAKPPPSLAMVVTQIGYTFGTPGYIAPELLAGRPADARSDLFSVGVTLYRMLAGSMPYRRAPAARDRFEVAYDEPRPLERCVRGLPQSVYRIVETALAKDPNERFQTASAFLIAIESVSTETWESGAWLPATYDSTQELTSSRRQFSST
jgi:eukaryotic-like serine/threonine-protein kinase